ncbi:hypothetical protein FOA52_001705 [Chlamydomonas sp. UWO 241]|nr:hypothetical protein FOA52_001705 [Chlamydomonas sp. UWO 241]
MASPASYACVHGARVVSKCRGGEAWTRLPCVLGIDEAGRGPVLGPMVYSAAYCPLSYDIASKQYDDSKQLTEAKRESLFAAINADDNMGWCTEILSAHYISSLMLSRNRTSLNKIAEDSTFKIIQTILDAGVNLTEVYVDTVGDADRYADRLSQRFNTLKFKVCPKADSIYPIVSAASIVAKNIRDTSLTETQAAMGLTGKIGSGYPHDAATISWLKAHLHPVLGFPELVRFSWETASRMLTDQHAVGMAFEADAGRGDGTEDGPSRGQTKLVVPSCTSAALAETSAGSSRHIYFRTRKLQRVAEAF